MKNNNYSIEDFNKELGPYVAAKSPIVINEFNIVLEVDGRPYDVRSIHVTKFKMFLQTYDNLVKVSINQLYRNPDENSIHKINVDLKTLAKYINITREDYKPVSIYKFNIREDSFQYQIYKELRDELIATLTQLNLDRYIFRFRFESNCTFGGYDTRNRWKIDSSSGHESNFILGCKINLLDESISIEIDQKQSANKLYYFLVQIDLDKVESNKSCQIINTMLTSLKLGGIVSFSEDLQSFIIKGDF